jgi:cytochrome b561
MKLKNDTSGWGLPSRAIHWITAGIFLWTMGLGVYMTRFVSDPIVQFGLTQTHKSWGFLVFALAVMRVVWLLFNHTRPEPGADAPRYETIGARVSHAILYTGIFLLPLSGWVMSAASPLQDLLNIENIVFDWFALPDPWVPGVKWIEETAHVVHDITGKVMALTLLVHIGAALKHHFVNKDRVLARMVKGA